MNDIDELVRKHNAVVDLLAQWERLAGEGGQPHVDVDKLRVGPAPPRTVPQVRPTVERQRDTCDGLTQSGAKCIVPLKAGVHVDGLANHYNGPGRVNGAKGFVRGTGIGR